jgi:hypothetical protein
MRHVMHLMAADVRRCRWPLLLWIGLAATGAASEAALWRAVTPSAGQTAAYALTLFWLAGSLLSVALVPLVVQGDPAVGGRAFWMTRPIHPVSLAVAKIVLLASLLVGLPIVLEAAAMTAHAVPPREIGLVALDMALLRGMVLAMLLTVAALTPTMTRFVVWCVAMLVAASLLAPIGVTAAFSLRDSAVAVGLLSLVGTGPADPLGAARTIVAALAIAAAGVLAVVLQYRRRSARVTFGILGAGAAAALLAAVAWPWPTFQRDLRAPDWARDPSALRLVTADGVAWHHTPSRSQDAPAPLLARARLRAPHVPDGWIVAARLASASVDPVDQPAVVSRRHHGVSMVAANAGAREDMALRQVLDVDRLAAGLFGAGTSVLFAAPAPLPTAPSQRLGRYHGVFDLTLSHLEVAATLPLERGSSFQEGGYRLIVDDVELHERAVRLDSRTTSVRSLFAAGPGPRYEVFLRNRARREAVRGREQGRLAHVIVPGVGIWSVGGDSTGFSRVRARFVFPAYNPLASAGIVSGGIVVVDEDWLEEAEIVIVRYRPGGAVEGTLTIDEFPLPARSQG